MSRRSRAELEPLNLALIVVEGKTEALYLKHLKERNSNVEVIVCESENKNPSKMVDNCIQKMREKDVDTSQGDIVFCVFDVDNNSVSDLHNAMIIAEEKGIQLIVSNPRFEIWLLMHFRSVSGLPIDADLEDMLSRHMGCGCSKAEDVWGRVCKHMGKAMQISGATSSKEGLVSPEDYFCCRCSTSMHTLI